MFISVRIFAESLSPHLVWKSYEGKNHICFNSVLISLPHGCDCVDSRSQVDLC